MSTGGTGGGAQNGNWTRARAGAARAPANFAVMPCMGARPLIAVNWRDNDFGRIRKGTTPVRTLVITSTGLKDLTISAILLGSNTQFKLLNPPATPIVLAPNASTSVQVQFAPNAYGQKNTTITINSNAANEPSIVITVSGKRYSIITFVVETEVGATKMENVSLKVKQGSQAEQVITTDNNGQVQLETEDGTNFSVTLAEHADLLEFRSSTTA